MSADPTRYDQKLEFILRTSARIFAEKGYHSTSMRDISRETKVSLAGLYHYCRSKDELLFLIQDNCFRHVLGEAKKRLQGVCDPIEKLRLFIENHLSFFAANMAEMKVLSHEAESLRGELGGRVASTKGQYTRLLRKILSEVHQTSGSKEKAIDLTVATYALFGMMNWIYNWYDPAGKLSVGELVENLTRLFLTGFISGESAAAISFLPTHKGQQLSVWRNNS
jgi:AcrR family transcriptional regulator